ncbi:hypothetical protein [Lutibacter citreus]|uniref:hypothetical protein n=1 Tax=Lutibacter citreus TaxID=2138210 RepID=UPI000DBE3E78|nr:hypothetical protein [Lutibacter citreus]
MKKVYIPSKITSGMQGYELLLRFQDDLKGFSDAEIQISFLYVIWFEANLVAVLGAIIEDLEWKRNDVSIVEVDNYSVINNVLYRNGFFPRHGLNIHGISGGNTQISYKMFRKSEPHLYNDYIQAELLDNSAFPMHSRRLGGEIKRNIFELFENARTHGECSYIHTCGQFYPIKKKLNITIVDTGTTIIKNVRKHLKIDLEACECIDWAMEMNNTTKEGNTPGGLGLGLLFQFIRLNQGKIQVVSSNGYWELIGGKKRKMNLDFYFSGTIANLEFNLSQDELYQFADEVVDLDNIF